jgi:hypothetical protein
MCSEELYGTNRHWLRLRRRREAGQYRWCLCDGLETCTHSGVIIAVNLGVLRCEVMTLVRPPSLVATEYAAFAFEEHIHGFVGEALRIINWYDDVVINCHDGDRIHVLLCAVTARDALGHDNLSNKLLAIR